MSRRRARRRPDSFSRRRTGSSGFGHCWRAPAKLDLDDMARTQTDVQGRLATVGAIVARLPEHPARAKLIAWDGRYEVDSEGAVVFEALMTDLATRLPRSIPVAAPYRDLDSTAPAHPGDTGARRGMPAPARDSRDGRGARAIAEIRAVGPIASDEVAALFRCRPLGWTPL